MKECSSISFLLLQPLLQAGGHGTSITQCKSAKIITSKTIPMQVDGEACKVAPSIITLTHLNKVPMLAKTKFGKIIPAQTALDNLKINVHKISMTDYEQHHYDKDLLAQAGEFSRFFALLHSFNYMFIHFLFIIVCIKKCLV